MKIRSLLIACGLLGLAHAADAANIALLTGPQDPSQMNATINGVILQINAILAPLTGGPFATGVNMVALAPATTGNPAVITVQPGGDANGSIEILPGGNGNIVLFNALNSTTTGVLQFANAASFVKSSAVTACPGALLNRPPLGLQPNVTGYVVIKDWLGVSHGLPSC